MLYFLDIQSVGLIGVINNITEITTCPKLYGQHKKSTLWHNIKL